MKLQLFYPTSPAVRIQPFGTNGEYYRANGINILGHNGEDYKAYSGQAIRAAHDGLVTFTGQDGAGGLTVVIRTNEKYEYKGQETYFKTIYVHLKSFAVPANTQVKAGDIIGFADSTGFSTGDHLHFGLKPVLQGEQDWAYFNLEQNNGYFGAIDPTPYWNGILAENATKYTSLLEQLLGLLKMQLELLRSTLTR